MHVIIDISTRFRNRLREEFDYVRWFHKDKNHKTSRHVEK